jgi:hypothetical protein
MARVAELADVLRGPLGDHVVCHAIMTLVTRIVAIYRRPRIGTDNVGRLASNSLDLRIYEITKREFQRFILAFMLILFFFVFVEVMWSRAFVHS